MSQFGPMPPSPVDGVTVPFRVRSGRRDDFLALFREGMGLVEETANYLDGPGRRESKALTPFVSLAYATESMRLTTRLTQMATWLLARRAVLNGETLPNTGGISDPLLLPPITRTAGAKGFEELPARLKQLIEASYDLYAKIHSFDTVDRAPSKAAPLASNGVATQLARLEAAFAGQG
jgi:regulator of CtrA degradation